MSESKSSFDTILGGLTMTVAFRNPPAEAIILVRQLTIEEYPALLLAIEDEGKQVELYCQIKTPAQAGKAEEWTAVPEGWAKTLTLKSHDHVMAAAEELNRDFFSRWLRRKLEKIEMIRPGMTEKAFSDATSASSLRRSAQMLGPVSQRPKDFPLPR